MQSANVIYLYPDLHVVGHVNVLHVSAFDPVGVVKPTMMVQVN